MAQTLAEVLPLTAVDNSSFSPTHLTILSALLPLPFQSSVVAQSRRMAPITANHFHKLREGIIRLENENRSFLIKPLPAAQLAIGKQEDHMPDFLALDAAASQ
jgi:hypothetical protein